VVDVTKLGLALFVCRDMLMMLGCMQRLSLASLPVSNTGLLPLSMSPDPTRLYVPCGQADQVLFTAF
jgi:hypothetical protein